MNYKLIFKIAKALLLARWRQSLVAAIGVTFGIGMFITLLSFMTGLNEMLDGLVINRTPHVRLYNDVKPNPSQAVNKWELYKGYYNFIYSLKSSTTRQEIYNGNFIMKALEKDERVLGFAQRLTTQVFFNNGSLDLNGVINGIEADKERQLFSFNDYIVAGSGADLQNISNAIILGKPLAAKLQLNIGDVVPVTTAAGDRYTLKLVGLFQSGINDLDKVQSYTSLKTAQKIMGKPNNYITEIAIKVKDFDKAPALAREYAKLYDTDAEDIQTANATFETGTRIRLIISYSVGITLLIVAAFGIYNILNMLIYEKIDSIAILNAIGFSGRDVKSIFLTISLSIGFFGGLAGLVVGFTLSNIIDRIPFNTQALPTVTTYPINYNPLFYLVGIVFSVITTYLAGFFPAKRASSIDPVIIIRGK